MSNKTAKPNNTTKKVEEPVTIDESFNNVWTKFWNESGDIVNHDQFLLNHLKVNYPDDYDVVREILKTKTTDWKKDLAIKKHFKAQNMLPKVVKTTKKATNGKSKGAK